MAMNIDDLIEKFKQREQKRADEIEKQINNGLEKIGGLKLLKEGYFELKIQAERLNDEIALLITDRYNAINKNVNTNYELVKEIVDGKEKSFYKFSFRLKKK